MRGNTVTLNLNYGRVAQTGNLWQFDYGQRLILAGVSLPSAYEVHFSNAETGNSKTVIGDSTGVDIPDEYLLTGDKIHVWVYLHDGESDGETEYHGIINVSKRAKPTDQEPTPVQQSEIDQAIAALNAGISTVEEIAEGIPQTIDTALEEAKESGEFDGKDGDPGKDGVSPVITVTDITGGHRVTITDATGRRTVDVMDGEPGTPGDPGQPGADGVSPTVAVSPITDGHRVIITDKTGPHSFDVMDGEKGDPGDPGDPTELIDDTSTTDTDKVWSAKKSADECSELSSAINQKQDAPSVAGTAGQVLGLDSNLDPVWLTPSGGGGTVDDELSTSSTNPVQNKVITNELNGMKDMPPFNQSGIVVNASVVKDYPMLVMTDKKATSVTVSGANLWDEETRVGVYGSGNGIFESGNNLCNVNPVHIAPETEYYFAKPSSLAVVVLYYRKSLADGDVSSYLGYEVLAAGTNVFTTVQNAEYLNFYAGTAYGEIYNHDIGINYPKTATSYEAASHQTINVANRLARFDGAGHPVNIYANRGEITVCADEYLPNALSDLRMTFIVAGAIRNEGNGWEFISNDEHTPINVSSVTTDNGNIIISYSKPAGKVISFVITGDEEFSRYYTVGASVGTNVATCYVYQDGTKIDASQLSSQYGNFWFMGIMMV